MVSTPTAIDASTGVEIPTDRAQALAQLIRKHTHVGYCPFPSDGRCYSCGRDLVAHYQQTGYSRGTSCPLCHSSFVE